MQSKSPILDDLAKMLQGANGAAQAAGEEFRTLFKAQGERFAADMDLVKREEVEALKTLARDALERAEKLEARVAELEAKLKVQG